MLPYPDHSLTSSMTASTFMASASTIGEREAKKKKKRAIKAKNEAKAAASTAAAVATAIAAAAAVATTVEGVTATANAKSAAAPEPPDVPQNSAQGKDTPKKSAKTTEPAAVKLATKKEGGARKEGGERLAELPPALSNALTGAAAPPAPEVKRRKVPTRNIKRRNPALPPEPERTAYEILCGGGVKAEDSPRSEGKPPSRGCSFM